MGRPDSAAAIRRPAARRLWLLLAVGLATCAADHPAAPPQPPPPAVSGSPAGAAKTIFVTSNGWHSSIVLARADVAPGRIPEAADVPQARFLEFGWGDADYYPAQDPGIGLALAALLAPTPSVVHMAGLAVDPARRYPTAEVIALSLDAPGLARLVDFIHATFRRQGRPRAAATGPGLYADSRFYPAVGRFHLMNTCNTWTARALAAAGFAVTGQGITTAEELMEQVRALGGEDSNFRRPAGEDGALPG